MVKYCGLLSHIGNWSGGMLMEEDRKTGRRSARARIRGEIDSVTIGDTTLKKPACTEGLFPFLTAGRESCLYIYKHFLFKKYIIGVKYTDDGTKHLMPANEVRGTVLQYLFVWPLLLAIPGLLAGSLLGLVIRGLGDYLPPLGLLATTVWCWWSALSLWRDLAAARAD
jgi:hypothetical protein